MKKIISIVLALVLTCALAVTCFATLAADGTGSDSAPVKVTVTTNNEGTVVYGADVSFDTAVTYAYGKTWSPSELKYVDNETGAWTDNECSVTVTNKSNAALYAKAEFAASNNKVSVNNGTEAVQYLTCEAATIGAPAAPAKALFKLAGNLVGIETENNVAGVGTITVTFSATEFAQ